MMQSFTFIDVVGNQAQYAVSNDDFRWSTDHGDSGVAQSFAEAQYRARTTLKGSMAANRRSDELSTAAKYSGEANRRPRDYYATSRRINASINR